MISVEGKSAFKGTVEGTITFGGLAHVWVFFYWNKYSVPKGGREIFQAKMSSQNVTAYSKAKREEVESNPDISNPDISNYCQHRTV